MNRFTHDFHTEASKVRLTDAERSRIQSALLSRMQAGAQPIRSPYVISSLFYRKAALTLGMCLVVIGIIGGTAFAAQDALPGDTLYPIKVGITEPVRGALAFSNEAKAAWNASIAVTRLAEGEALATKGTLTATTSAELAADFTEHAQAFSAIANDIGSSSPIAKNDISTEFSRSVATRSAALLSAGKMNTDNPIALRASGDLVLRATSDEAGNASPEAKRTFAPKLSPMHAMLFTVEGTTTPSAAPSLEELSQTAHSALTAATTTLATATLPDDVASTANARAAALENLMVKADAEFALDSTTEATADFTRAIQAIEDLENLVQISTSTAP